MDSKKEPETVALRRKTMGLAALSEKLPDTEAFDETLRLPPEDGSAQAAATTSGTLATGIHSIQLHLLPRLSFAKKGEATEGSAGEEESEERDLEIQSLLGEGGMGQIYLARQRSLGRDVAIKCIKPTQQSQRNVRLLLHEGYITGQLEHPNVIPVHALGKDATDLPLLVMKRVEGVVWRDLIQDPEHPAWAQAKGWSDDPLAQHLEIMMEVCSAISYAHSKGYLHLDIKPDNVMLGAFGEIYLLDWGIAQSKKGEHTADALFSVAGTPAYMAPEMLDPSNTPPDERTDVYLLGATLHEVLTGEVKHKGKALPEIIYAISSSLPYDYPSHIPRELAAICNQATHSEPEERFASAKEFRSALVHYLRHRDSIQLSDKAHEKLARLIPQLAQASKVHEGASLGPKEQEEIRQAEYKVHRLFQETLFGFAHALEQWKENESATDGTQQTLESMARFELARGHINLARNLFQELPVPNPALQEAITQAELRAEEARQEHEAFVKMAQEKDPKASQNTRLWSMVCLTSLIMAMVSFALVKSLGDKPLVKENLLGPTTILLVIVCIALIVFRKRIFVNAYSKSFSMMLVFSALYLWIHRILALHRVNVGFSSILMDDLLLISAFLAMGGVTVKTWLLPIAALQIVSALVMFFYPHAALPLMMGTGFTTMVLIIVFIWRGKG